MSSRIEITIVHYYYMDQQFTTPMMKQYEVIKKDYKDCLLFYRMGDFYELFLEDAHIGSKVLDITLTSRAKGKDGRIPMAGVPFHAVDPYLNKLVKAGYKVAICEQISEPNKKGIIEREVVRVVTPGTILDEKALNRNENNFITSLVIEKDSIAIAACDISTGYFVVLERDGKYLEQTIKDEFSTLQPAECILQEKDYLNTTLLKILKHERSLNITHFKEWDIYTDQAEKMLVNHFHVSSLLSFGIQKHAKTIIAAAALLGYLMETQKDQVHHITSIQTVEKDDHLILDKSTVQNLELFSTLREQDTKATLLGVMDKTNTAMGARLLRFWMKKPLVSKESIIKRYDTVDYLLSQKEFTKHIENLLHDITDIERLLSRLSLGLGNARDLVNIAHSLQRFHDIKTHIESQCDDELLLEQAKNIDHSLINLVQLVFQTLVNEPPITVKEGGMIRPGVNQKLDELRRHIGGGKEWIAKLEITERERTAISSLKVRYNKVFGFYIEISKANMHLVPDNYIRKQTLVNGERFITPELKEYEELILSAQEKIFTLEYQLFSSLLSTVLKKTAIIQKASTAIATIDCLVSFATIAKTYRYTRPTIQEHGAITIKEGRHPVVERLLSDTQFVPNSVLLDPKCQQLLIITGPNMAGKSVFIRQVALLVLMAQMGSFIPAQESTISITDRLFVRSGASDVITQGLSTFMVEMLETAYILHHATKQSLIVMDEIGRGTSTYDGISIAWAIAEYIITHSQTRSKTLFATHYHELQKLEKTYPNKIKNYHMSVIQEEKKPVFLHTLQPGGASASFGIAVAQLAGLPSEVIVKAEQLLTSLEKKHTSSQKVPTRSTKPHSIEAELKSIDLNNTTPMKALQILEELQKKLQ